MGFSTRRHHISKKKAFTIREILVVIVVISVGLLSVVVVLTNGMNYVQKTRQKVVALNLAREGIEAIYHIRDTNWMRWAWVKDSCWLKTNPLVDEWTANCALDDQRFSSGTYVLQRLTTWEQEYFALNGPWTWLHIWDIYTGDDALFALCQQSGYRNACMGQLPITSEGTYFREIEWLWLYLKDELITWWLAVFCTWSQQSNCWNNRAKEFRFCSKVSYIGDGTGEVKLCGVLTNFITK